MDQQPLLGESRTEEQINVRSFVPGSDDDACKALEARATMTPWFLKWFADGHIVHLDSFDRKIRQFPEGIILVAESSRDGIVGMVCGALKTMNLHWIQHGRAPIKAMYIFDLRVASNGQHRGLGSRLLVELERQGQAMGACYAYLSVNKDNAKARGLFHKFGFEECSSRHPIGGPLAAGPCSTSSVTECVPGGSVVEKLEGDLASQFLSDSLKGSDCVPCDLSSLTASPFYLGTFVARDFLHNDASPSAASASGSAAAVSLWDSSALSSFSLVRFAACPAWWFEYRSFRALWACGVLMISGLWLRHEWRLLQGGNQIWAASEGLCVAALACGVWKFWSILCLIYHLICTKGAGGKMRARLFAPWCSGPRGHTLLAEAVREAQGEARRRGFLMWICNLDEASPVRSAFGARGSFRTLFMHKSLDHLNGTTSCPRISNTAFHDPRDI